MQVLLRGDTLTHSDSWFDTHTQILLHGDAVLRAGVLLIHAWSFTGMFFKAHIYTVFFQTEMLLHRNSSTQRRLHIQKQNTFTQR